MNAPEPSSPTVPLPPGDAAQPRLEVHSPHAATPPSPTTDDDWGVDAPTRDESAASPPRAPAIEVPGFEILGEIARGGMGVVYKARQQSLDRIVAIKCLPLGFSQDSDRLARFRREAQAAARFVNKGILPVYDVLEVGAVPLLVMPYIDGTDLARIIADRVAVRQGKLSRKPHPWATLSDSDYLARILPVLDRAVEALTLLHRADVVHRDIKPSNILVDRDGHAWLSDFGLARFDGQDGLTGVGQGLGTPGFMSPEQWDGGARVDGRADVFSMGVTLYQALTLVLPYGRERLTEDTRLPAPPTNQQPLLPADMNAVILRALAPDLVDRYRSSAELQGDWSRVRAGVAPRRKAPQRWRRLLRQRRGALAGAAGVLLALLVAFRLMPGGVPANEDPAGPVLRTVAIATDPPGANIVFVPLDAKYGQAIPEDAVSPEDGQKTPCTLKLAPGLYFVEAQVPGRGFHQVYRYVPTPDEQMGENTDGYLARYPQSRWSERGDGTIKLASIQIPSAAVTAGMARLEGRDFTMGTMTDFDGSRPPHTVSVPTYYLDTHEVTEKEYRALQQKLSPPQNLPPDLAFRPRGDAYPVTKISYRDALSWAERAGKRLPTEAEYEFAATNGGHTRFPWGGSADRVTAWPFGHVGTPAWDHTDTKPPIFGLYSNVDEWTCSWRITYPGVAEVETPRIQPNTLRVIRGGPNSVALGTPDVKQCLQGPRQRFLLRTDAALPGLGFRCARSARPAFLHHATQSP